jgi:hypothetical protein
VSWLRRQREAGFSDKASRLRVNFDIVKNQLIIDYRMNNGVH